MAKKNKRGIRKDIARVIIDCYRLGGRVKTDRSDYSIDDEAPKRARIRPKNACKLPGDKLGAIKGYLRKNVGRPWNKIYSEIREQLSHDSMSQSHVLDHISGYVEIHTKMDGKEVVKTDGGKIYDEYFVHPVNGLLFANKEQRLSYRRTPPAQPLWNDDKTAQYHQVDGIWYEVKLALVPKDGAIVHDVFLDKSMGYQSRKDFFGNSHTVLHISMQESSWNNKTNYGGPYYAYSKRQLNSREIRKLKLNKGK